MERKEKFVLMENGLEIETVYWDREQLYDWLDEYADRSYYTE